MTKNPRKALHEARRIVVKVGTAVVTHPDGRIAVGRLGMLVEQLRSLRVAGHEVLLVSSGAVGLGADRLGFTSRPTAVVDRQACAAAGQGSLMAFYDGLFRRAGVAAAQVLLTDDDFQDRRRYVNLAATLQRLFELGAIPVINENDTVSTVELALHAEGGRQVFGDNDRLSALVAAGLGADLLVLLTNVDAIYTGPPDRDPDAARIATWSDQDVQLGATSIGGRGGMGAKIDAAIFAANAGVPAVVASGFEDGVLERVLAGDDVGTLFPAHADGLDTRQRWMAFATVPAGRLVVDAGARAAMVDRKASLLPPGVIRVEGEFPAGSVVSIVDEEGTEFARGISARSSGETRSWQADGGRSRALVHRDNIVILEAR